MTPMTHLKGLSARYMRLMGKCNNSATRLWTAEDVEIGLHPTQTATNHLPTAIAYVTINNLILPSRTLINNTHISHTPDPTNPTPDPTKPAHLPVTDAVQPMFRLCQSALTNHGAPIRQSRTVTTRGVSPDQPWCPYPSVMVPLSVSHAL